MLIKPYIPKNFGKEYYYIKGHDQYPMFLAVALGVKPSFDDWIPVKKYDEFVKACAKYGLVVEPDVVFTQPKNDKKNIVGGENITTTFRSGKRFDKEETEEGNVHVFVAKTREKALEAKKFGWYSVVINNRSTNKPFIDHLRFGECLGFPDCCIDFFRKYNNWHLYSHPYETFKNTLAISGRAKGSYYCNNFLMDHTYFFIHHLSCSYRCEKTIEFAKKVEEKIAEVEQDYVQKTVEMLKKPLLVFGEKNFVIFNGNLSKNKSDYILEYDNCEYLKNPARPEESINFFNSIKSGNKIMIENNNLIIKDNDSILKTIEKKPEWFMISFD
ncbi:MAG: hypothetical protein ACFFG0_11685 [Candidatus Thorarchaeota archaeon]